MRLLPPGHEMTISNLNANNNDVIAVLKPKILAAVYRSCGAQSQGASGAGDAPSGVELERAGAAELKVRLPCLAGQQAFR